ncbi:MAG TPA: hemerythrin domain-containing protein, partial [Polyangia bacterium]|nr:hemerythrin domain-containing protein [Polyangia bacterium]
MTTNAPDIFTNVHKGIRQALFAATTALGRAGADDERLDAARAVLRRALRFVAHHGDNEDVLLLPLLAHAAPAVHARMTAAHAALHEPLAALEASLEVASSAALYARAADFVARYLDHMHEEEHALEPQIRAALTVDQLAQFGRDSVARTAPADQRMMIAFMLPAMPRV